MKTPAQYAHETGIPMWIPAPANECTQAEIACGPISAASAAYIASCGSTHRRPAKEGEVYIETIGAKPKTFRGLYNKWNPAMISAGYTSPLG